MQNISNRTQVYFLCINLIKARVFVQAAPRGNSGTQDPSIWCFCHSLDPHFHSTPSAAGENRAGSTPVSERPRPRNETLPFCSCASGWNSRPSPISHFPDFKCLIKRKQVLFQHLLKSWAFCIRPIYVIFTLIKRKSKPSVHGGILLYCTICSYFY